MWFYGGGAALAALQRRKSGHEYPADPVTIICTPEFIRRVEKSSWNDAKIEEKLPSWRDQIITCKNNQNPYKVYQTSQLRLQQSTPKSLIWPELVTSKFFENEELIWKSSTRIALSLRRRGAMQFRFGQSTPFYSTLYRVLPTFSGDLFRLQNRRNYRMKTKDKLNLPIY